MRFLIYSLLFYFSFLGSFAQAGSCEQALKNFTSSRNFVYWKTPFSKVTRYKSIPLNLDNHRIANNYGHGFNPKILRKGDIRGKFLIDFDFGFTKIFSESLIQYLKGKIRSPEVLIAYDAREYSFPISELIAKELTERGVYVGKLGLVPTPTAYHLLEAYGYTAAIIVTASHNPKEYAGIKTVLNSRYKVVNAAPEIHEIILNKITTRDRAKNETVSNPTDFIKFTPSTVYDRSLENEFQDLKSFPYRFVVDASHGSAGPIAKEVFKNLGLKAHFINSKPDGSFPNHEPNPTIETNLKQLKQTIKETNSKFGIAFDGDGDRAVFVTSKGETLSADQFVYLFLEDLMQSHPENPHLVIDVQVSNWFINKAKQMGFELTTTKTGYYFLKEHIKAETVMAFERSAHIIFNDRFERGHDDGIYSALRFIELIHKRGLDYFHKKYNEVKSFQTRSFVLRDVDRSKDDPLLVDKLKNYLDQKKVSYEEIDGVRVSWGDSWAIFRFSNTENIATITVQAETEEKISNIAKEFSTAIGRNFVIEN